MRSPLGALAARIASRPTNSAPVPYVGRGIRQALPFGARNDSIAHMQAMGSVGTLFAIVHRTSNATSQAEWHLYRKAKSGRVEDRTEVTRHAALDLWNRPNKFFTQQELIESTQQHVDLTGEGWWVIARHPQARSIPLELWPVRPDRMVPVPDREEFLSGYLYLGPDGEQVPLRLDEVIQLRMPNPLDPYRGMGPVQSILTDLDSTRYSAEWNRNFFVNSALPSGIIEAPTNLSDDEFDELRDRWDEQHRGVAAAHRVAILEGGLTWKDRTFTQRDMQFTELRGLSREVIREAFGFPKAMLGTVDDVNRANAEAGEVMFARWLIVPRLERIKQALNNDLLPLFGSTSTGLEFDYVNPTPADRAADSEELDARAEAAQRLVAVGFEPSGVLSAVGLPEIPYIGPPASMKSPALSNRAPLQVGARVPLVLGAAEPEEPREDWQDRLEDLLADWASVSADQRAELAEQIQTLVDADDRRGLSELAVSSEAGAGLLEAAMQAQAAAAGERMVSAAQEQGVTITAAAVAGALAAALAAGAAVTAAALAAGLAVAAGREALRVWAPGASGPTIASRVREFLEGLSDATLRAELGGAIWAAEQQGRFATLEQAEADGKGATWYEASEIRDQNTCIQCKDVDGERYETLDDARSHYPYGGYFVCLGGIRCRGTIEPHWSGS